MIENPGNWLNPSEAPAAVASGLSASHITRGPGVSIASLKHGFSADNWSTVTEDMDGRANALENGEYFTFSVGIEPGATASFTNLDHTLRRSAINSPMFFEWQYSFDDFATPGTTIKPVGSDWDLFGWNESYFTFYGRSNENVNYAPTPEDPPFLYMQQRVDYQDPSQMPIFDLTGIDDLQNIAGGQTVSFRLYGWGNASTTQTTTVAFKNDGLTLNGTVIPEPSTYALIFGIGGIGAALFIRRRKKSF